MMHQNTNGASTEAYAQYVERKIYTHIYVCS
jgi:hypothetical protein